tara:strand:+ start:1102 stop:1476 length:375 start_codon:yes stop_codon:yes gene_type:complete
LLYEYVKDEVRYTLKNTTIYRGEWIYPIDGKTYEGFDIKYKKAEWKFWEKDLNKKRKNGNSFYDKILAEVKSECTLFEIEQEDVLTYDCPEEVWLTDGVNFKGELVFLIADDRIIQLFFLTNPF